MEMYDIAVVGGGPAGCMAAIRAGQRRKKVVVLERNDTIGRKLLLTGNGRCNLTNTAMTDVFIENFGRQGRFLRSAFYDFSNRELMGFFRARGLQLKEEAEGRVFPVTDKAASVAGVLKNELDKNRVDVRYNYRVTHFKIVNNTFCFDDNDEDIGASKLILATGGVSYPHTGSTGDGYILAKKLGHSVTDLLPALVPLKIKEEWVKELQGISLQDAGLTFTGDQKKKIAAGRGGMLFTHFGLSGPRVLDLSGRVVRGLRECREIGAVIDLIPGRTLQQTEKDVQKEMEERGIRAIKNILAVFIPQRMVPVFLCRYGIDISKKANQVTREERKTIVGALKHFPLTVNGTLPQEQAMVTAGGVSIKDIKPRTMESQLIPNLFFAGEIIDGCAGSGGYNLQQAFSTGYLAGEHAAFEL